MGNIKIQGISPGVGKIKLGSTTVNKMYRGAVQVFPADACTGYPFADKAELQTGVNLWVSNRAQAIIDYGQINTWCTGAVTDMSSLFYTKNNFNDDISNWDVSNVTTMTNMFSGATVFNQPLNSWDTSSVTSMLLMFEDCPAFNQPIGSWDVSNVTKTYYMFTNASSFNQDISSWDMSSVDDMLAMFSQASSFNQNINGWDVSSVTNAQYVFANATAFNQPLYSWNVSAMTSTVGMFDGATAFNQDLSTWSVGNVINMTDMFKNATSFNKDISLWNVSSVVEFKSMFDGASSFNKSLGLWNLNNALGGIDMFGSAGNPSGLSVANYSNTLIGWAGNAPNLKAGFTCDAYGIKFSAAAQDAISTLTANPLNWFINNAGLDNNLMSLQIDTALSTGTSFVLPLTIPTAGGGTVVINWGDNLITTLTNSSSASETTHTYALSGKKDIHITGNIETFGFKTSTTEDREKLTRVYAFGSNYASTQDKQFQGCSSITSIPFSTSINGIADIERMFVNCSSLFSIGPYDFNAATDGERAFDGCAALTTLPSTMTLTGMLRARQMFFNSGLTSLPSGMVLNNLLEGDFMFMNCSLTALPANMVLSNVTSSNQMFRYNALTVLPSGFLLNKSTNMNSMFNGANLTNLPTGMGFDALTNGQNIFGTNFGTGANTIVASRITFIYLSLESNNPNNGGTFAAPNSKYTAAGATARAALVARGWSINDDGQQ